ALSISAPHPVAARLVVGPDDVQDVGVVNERYDAVAPSLNGISWEVDGSHSKSSPGPSFVPGRPLLGEPLCSNTALHIDEFGLLLRGATVQPPRYFVKDCEYLNE